MLLKKNKRNKENDNPVYIFEFLISLLNLINSNVFQIN